jgi:hypothetical protein
MKLKDIFLVSNLYIKKNKKAKRLIRGLAMSLIFLIPVMWITLTFYYDFISKMDNSEYSNIVTMEYSEKGISIKPWSPQEKLNIRKRACTLSFNIIWHEKIIMICVWSGQEFF